MLQEFKEFIVKGNAFDLAVGVIIGGAFGAMAGSFVTDIMMPPLGLLMGGTDFSNIFVTLRDGATAAGPYPTLAAAKAAGAVTLNVGAFVNTVINLVIVGFVIFLLVKSINAARKPPTPAAATPEDVLLLREIRDALKK